MTPWRRLVPGDMLVCSSSTPASLTTLVVATAARDTTSDGTVFCLFNGYRGLMVLEVTNAAVPWANWELLGECTVTATV